MHPQVSPGTTRPHITALDGLRGLAILLVIPHNADILEGTLSLPVAAAAHIMYAGWIGVQLFFVLSGYLITSNLLDMRSATNYFQTFFARRVLRIFPLYYLVLLLTFVAIPFAGLAPVALQETTHNQFWLWIFLSNWTQPYGENVTGFTHFWSLAVEEQFYLVWPFVIRFVAPRRLIHVCLGLIATAIAVRTGMRLLGADPEAIYTFTICRMDALAIGAAAAVVMRGAHARDIFAQREGQVLWGSFGLLIVGALVSKLYAALNVVDQIIGYTILAAGFAGVLAMAVQPSVQRAAWLVRALQWRPLISCGRYSYAMYVVHLPLHVYVTKPLLLSTGIAVTPAVAFGYSVTVALISFLIGMLSYHAFEKHFLRLKTHFRADRAPASASAPA
ncbi:MAG TPA: acyltransferase [Steroidobacteraceae bacterium]|nr:acyltransferase [Steroidobacteraceae bacterium]